MNDYNFDDIDTFRNGFKNSKLKDFFSRQSMDSDQETHDYPDLDFNYADTDTLTNEMAELYSYTEQPEFQLNVKAFEDYMEMLKLKPCWKRLTYSEKTDVIVTLLDQLDVLDKNIRLKCARCFLYLVQGCWAECQSDIEQQALAKENVLLLYKHGVFANFMELFYAESNVTSVAIQRKVSVNINDSTELRVILSIIYIFIEIIRTITNDDYAKNVAIRDECKTELQSPIEDELLLVKLFEMLSHFCVGNAPHYPIKKVLLLIWKTLLFTLGDTNELRRLKAERRREAGLDSYEEDTLQVVKTMRACSPPSGGGEMFESHQKRTSRQLRKSLIKQSSLDESLSIDYEGVPMDDDDYDEQQMNSNNASVSAENKDDNIDATLDENNANINDSSDADGGEGANYEEGGDNGVGIGNGNRTANESAVSVATSDDLNTTSTLVQAATTRGRSIEKVPSLQQSNKRLPWVPKIRNKDLDLFLDHVRLKFIGYLLPNDRDTVIGLPQPICEGVKVLKRYVYVSLSEVQMEKEENINKYPISQGEKEIPETAAEIVYRNLLPILQKSIIALLKVLLAAAPTSKTKTDTLNIMADVLPEEMPMTVLQSMKLGTDVNRHKEIIVKAVSAILLLLLKHFKMNHIYQFEFLSQYLVFANCIPLILKFFNQNISAYVGAKNVIPILDFPACVIGDQPELTSESLEIGDNQQCSWRNVFACINLLRVLTKVTKWKHSRIMMLVVFKSSPILRRTLKVRHPMMQLYILKLLKMQTKYLGRQWRKSNMKMMSAIYQKVRHRLHDDWAFGNDVDARPWDFQIEECSLRNAVDRFNNRRYFTHTADSEFTPLDVHITSVLSSQVDLTDEFKKHYYLWVQQEVFDKTINWDELVYENWI